eukprot:c17363_g1_i1.p1 GENE.c17363_g1_i1~~c17363_g1_i1.p1  ORF type:complete len:100 (+),score=18.00 c17363_g1_i1:45-344(+)
MFRRGWFVVQRRLLSIQHIVNTAKYPLHQPDSAQLEAVVQQCHRELQSRSFAHLRNFLTDDAVSAMLAEVKDLESKGLGYRSTEAHNIFLQDQYLPVGF